MAKICQKILNMYAVGITIGIGLLIAGIYCLFLQSPEILKCKSSLRYENITSVEYSNCLSAYHTDDSRIFCKNMTICKCGDIVLTVTEAIKGDVVIGYTLDNFNDTFYESRDDRQLAGSLSTNLSSKCKPFDYNQGLPIIPCGALANAMFTDKCHVLKEEQGVFHDVPGKVFGLLDDDFKKTFRNPVATNLAVAFKNFSKPINWTKNIWELDTEIPQNNGLQNEALIIWMHRDLPIRPIWRLNRSAAAYKYGLPKGKYILDIDYNYPNSIYNGSRTLTMYREYKTCSPNAIDTSETARYIVSIAGVFIGCLLLCVTATSIILYKQKDHMSPPDICVNWQAGPLPTEQVNGEGTEERAYCSIVIPATSSDVRSNRRVSV